MKKKLAIIGCGNMGAAVTNGMIKSTQANNFEISCYDVNQKKAAGLVEEFKTKLVLDTQELSQQDLLLLCIKPQDLVPFKRSLKTPISSRTAVISILAGMTIRDIENKVELKDIAVIRAMPNIAAVVGSAATVLCANQFISEETKTDCEKIFSAIGEVFWAEEQHLDAVTGLSGSGPAYVFMVIEALADGGVKMGLSRQLSLKLATQTVFGAAEIVKTSHLHPAVLKDQVTTPGGTTINAIHELEDRGLRAMLISAVETATKHSTYLREKFEKSQD